MNSNSNWIKVGAIAALGVGVAVVTVIAVKSYKRQRKPSVIVTLKDKTIKYPVKLIDTETVSHDTKRFRFALPSKDHILGHSPGHHIYITANIGGSVLVRPYTPVTSAENTGYFELLIKIYPKTVDHPEGGLMTQYLSGLSNGDFIEIRGPSGLVTYEGLGVFSIKPSKPEPAVPRTFTKLGLIAGGSGITPMLQFIRAIFNDIKDRTEVSLIFANKTEGDVLLKDEFDDLARKSPKQFKVWYTVDKATADWKQGRGYVTAQMIKEHLPPPGDRTAIMLCGPQAMVDYCTPSLNVLGYTPPNVIVL